MAIFRSYVEDLIPLLPTIWRKKADNILRLTLQVYYGAQDAVAQALEEYIDAWPIDTAAGWVLDDHWLPYHNLPRNGLTDAQARVFIHAKRLLNKSWGSGEQALQIFRVLLPPAAAMTFSYLAPKSWTVNITGVTLAETAKAITFMTKKPSPEGGGFSVCGDNGVAVVSDLEVFSYSSVHGAVTVAGFYGSVYGAGGGVQAGFAHAAGI